MPNAVYVMGWERPLEYLDNMAVMSECRLLWHEVKVEYTERYSSIPVSRAGMEYGRYHGRLTNDGHFN